MIESAPVAAALEGRMIRILVIKEKVLKHARIGLIMNAAITGQTRSVAYRNIKTSVSNIFYHREGCPQGRPS